MYEDVFEHAHMNNQWTTSLWNKAGLDDMQSHISYVWYEDWSISSFLGGGGRGGGGGGEERGGGFMHVQEHRYLLVREVYINLLPWQHCCCQGNVLNGSRPSVHIATITKWQE